MVGEEVAWSDLLAKKKLNNMYTEEFLKKIMQCGMFGYQYAKVLNILEIEAEKKTQFHTDFYNTESIVAQQYQKGKDVSDFVLDAKLFELAKGGNINAIKEFNLRKQKTEYETYREEITNF